MKIVAKGNFGAFVWELPENLAKVIERQAAAATEIGNELLSGKDVPDMTRFLTDELTRHVTDYLLLLQAVGLTGGPGRLLIDSFFESEMNGVARRCRDLLIEIRNLGEEGK